MILHRQEGISKDTGMIIIRYLTDRKNKKSKRYHNTNRHEGKFKNSKQNARPMKRSQPRKKISEDFALRYRTIKINETVLHY